MSDRDSRVPPRRISERTVLAKAEYFQDIGLWPPRSEVDPVRWLRNFGRSGSEAREYAANLLNAFLFVSSPMVERLFYSAVHALSSSICDAALTAGQDPTGAWNRFLEGLIVTYVEGEHHNPTKSGYAFARMARQVLGLSQMQILEPGEALAISASQPDQPVLFVDDFVGSGNQMIGTWQREYSSSVRSARSFDDRAKSAPGRFYYCPLVCTEYGHQRLVCNCQELTVLPVHELGPSDSLVGSESSLWPESLKEGAEAFLLDSSRRAGIVGGSPLGWKGFHDLALGVAFEHCVPDATMPLFYWDRNGWFPLVRRT